jgi:ribosomal protein L12E/L44/L45/RPP1/RPP2
MSDAEIKFANLQFRYTELLEKRIAQLEAAIAAPVGIPTAAAATAETNDKKKDDDDSSDDEKTKEEVRYGPLYLRPNKSSACQKYNYKLTFPAET